MPKQTTGAKQRQEYWFKNIQVLKRCMECLSSIHNLFFKTEFNISVPKKQADQSVRKQEGDVMETDPEERDGKITNTDSKSDLKSEWLKLINMPENIKSWYALKQSSKSLRKYNGLTEIEIQNLLKGDPASSRPYLNKMNKKIDTALRSYEAGLRNLPWKSVTIFGGFYSSPTHARITLKGCCSDLEIEQNIQRLPVSQFLLCELPLFPLQAGNEEHPVASSCSHTDNILRKKNAVRKTVQATNQKLSISETNHLTSEIVGEICPARWRTHTKACLQLLFGNPGLVIVDTIDQTCKTKSIAQVLQKDSFIVVTVSSLWSIKEDPGTMSLLQRHFDPEKTLATINVRYVSVYNTMSLAIDKQVRFEPGIFVEAFIYTGSKNQRWASQALDSSHLINGIPATLMSVCWLERKPCLHESSANHARVIDKTRPEVSSCDEKHFLNEPESKQSQKDKSKKEIVFEIKSETESDEEKSSDNEHSVQDVIHLLSGCARRVANKMDKLEKKKETLENKERVHEGNGQENHCHNLNTTHAMETKKISPHYGLLLLNDSPEKTGQTLSTNQVGCTLDIQSNSPCEARENTIMEQVDIPQAVQEMKNIGLHITNDTVNQIQQNNNQIFEQLAFTGHLPLSENPECSAAEHLPVQNSFEACKTSPIFTNRKQSLSLPQYLNFDQGSIRRPVLSKISCESLEISSSPQEVAENQGSNTWPFYETMEQFQKDIEYERYVAEITKNTNTKKKPSMEIGYRGPTPHHYGFGNPSVSDAPVPMDNFKRHDTSVEAGQIMDDTLDQSRTWPPWQLWHSSGSWNNEILSSINRLGGQKETW